jgi:hypothetical protein
MRPFSIRGRPLSFGCDDSTALKITKQKNLVIRRRFKLIVQRNTYAKDHFVA